MANISERQLSANRENAKKGGVKTSTGKLASRMNALKHGLLSQEVVLSIEFEADLSDLEKRLREDLKPVGSLEFLLVDRMVTCFWRLRRLLAVEHSTMEYQRKQVDTVGMIAFGMGVKPSEQQNEHERNRAMLLNEDMDKLTRYESSLERSIYKALHELQRIQVARNGDPSSPPIALDIHGE